MTAFFGNNYSFTELRLILDNFNESPYETILDLKLEGGNNAIIKRLQSKLQIMILNYQNNSYPDPPEDKGFETMCLNCHEDFETDTSTAYTYILYCCSECEDESND